MGNVGGVLVDEGVETVCDMGFVQKGAASHDCWKITFKSYSNQYFYSSNGSQETVC